MKTLIPILTLLLASASLTLAQSGAPAPGEHGGGHHGGPGGDKPHDPEARFKQLDTNGDGFLSLEELKAGPRGQKDPARAEARFKEMDTNADGKLSLEEFKAGAHGGHHDGDHKP